MRSLLVTFKKSFRFLLLPILLAFAVTLLNCGSDTHTSSLTKQFAFVRPAAGSGASKMSVAERAFRREHRQALQGVRHRKASFGIKPLTIDNAPGDDSIVLMNNDGTGETVIANKAGWFDAVHLGYDGKRGVAVAEDAGGYWQVYYVDLSNQSNPVGTQLTSEAADHYSAQLSWDGKKVVFTKWVESAGYDQVVIMSTSGGTETVISTPFYASYPTFTPDGKIVLENDDTDAIIIMNADGTGIADITSEQDPEHGDWAPSVSSDGKTVVLSRNGNIYTVSINGGTLTQLTTDGESWDPMFVKDKIVYVSYPASASSDELFSMNMDGTNQKQLTTNSVNEYFDWW